LWEVAAKMMMTEEGDGFTLAPDLVEALGIEDYTLKRDYGRERGTIDFSMFCGELKLHTDIIHTLTHSLTQTNFLQD
jgi:hypothetical protein